jgi:hypothetical protein
VRLSTCLFFATLAVIWGTTPARLRADDVSGQVPSTQYEETIQRGLHEFALEHWVEAKVLFAQAHALRPNARTLRGLGLACYELRQYVQAIEYFEAALVNGMQPLTPEMTSDVHTFLARAREFVSHIRLEVQPLTAELVIDGQPPPRLGADGSYSLDPGSHEIVVSAAGFEPHSRTLFAEGGKTMRLIVALKPLRSSYEAPAPLSAPAASTGSKSPAEAPEPSYLGPWLLVGISGTVAVAGGVMLGVAAANKDRVENADGDAVWSDYAGSYETGNALFPIGSVMLGVGLAGVAAGLGWRFMISPETPQSGAALQVSPCCVRISGRL